MSNTGPSIPRDDRTSHFQQPNPAEGTSASPSARNNDCNLLFGILALQMDFITRDALIRAMNAWVLEKTKPLGAILVEQGHLRPDSYQLLDALVQKHVALHGDDPQQSLAAVSSFDSIEDVLKQLGDEQVNATLDFVATAMRKDAANERTRIFVGAATSAGTRFRILRPHAEGGLGVVSVARDEELSRDVALKEIKARHAHHPESRARFLLEAEVTGRLEHPNIIPVYGLGQYADGRPFYVMRFIRGDNLKDACQRFHNVSGTVRVPKASGTRSVPDTLEFRKLLRRFIDVCNAIEYAHNRGVLHRDLKPGNIMLGKYGETLVVDWGLSKVVGRADSPIESSEVPVTVSSSSGSAETQYGSAVGTPAFMSPEQAAGLIDQLGPASDVYSLGATLYYLLTNRAPFQGDDLGAVLQQVQRGEFTLPRKLDLAIHPALEAICLKAMALKPADRYASARALADEVERWLADEPVSAYCEPISVKAARWARKHRTAVAACFGLVTAATVALAVSTILIKQEQVLTDKERIRAERQLAMSHIERGISELERGESAQGLANLGRAYRVADRANDNALRRSAAALLGAWQSACERRLVHTSNVTALAFSADGTTVLTAGRWAPAAPGQFGGRIDTGLSQVSLWDAVSGRPLGSSMQVKNHLVDTLTFSGNGKMIATGGGDISGYTTDSSGKRTTIVPFGQARLWDVATGKVLGLTIKEDNLVNVVAISPDGSKLATGCYLFGRTARLWDVATGKPIGPKHDDSVRFVTFSADGSKIATANGAVQMWDASTGQPLPFKLKGNASPHMVTFSPDGTKIATASYGSTIELWDAVTGQPLYAPMKQDDLVNSVVFSPDGTKLASACRDKTIRLWDAATGKAMGTPMKHDSEAKTLAFSFDGSKLASASLGNTVRVWDFTSSQPIRPPMERKEGVLAVAFSPDGSKLAAVNADHTVRLWDAATRQPLVEPMKQDAEKRYWLASFTQECCVAFSPDGTKLATAENSSSGQTQRMKLISTDSNSGAQTFGSAGRTEVVNASHQLRLWDATTGKPLGADMKHDDFVTSVVFSPDGAKVASASRDRTVRLWDAKTGKPVGSALNHNGWVQAVAFSPDGTKISTASISVARLWDAETGLPIGSEMQHDPGKVTAVAFSPDSKKVATAGEDNSARLWDARTGKAMCPPMKHDAPVLFVVFSQDGSKVATASEDNTARLWDVTTGQLLGAPLKHDDFVLALAFSPDGTKLATASADKTARLWDTGTCQPLGPALKHGDKVRSVSFRPDGTMIATVSEDKTVRLWPVPRSLPDDAHWITAYVDSVSASREDANGTMRPISAEEADEAWHEVQKSPDWLDYRGEDAALRARAWHEHEAEINETAGRWFAAAFHLRWLCKLDLNEGELKKRLATAEEQLKTASAATPSQSAHKSK
jgi:WD40 repeat protein/serine/threonine protein kinase